MREQWQKTIADIRSAWRYRWVALSLTWILSLAGWAYLAYMPDQYEASAQVIVSTNTDLREIIERQGLTISPDIISDAEQVRIALLGRPQLARVARETGLDRRASNEDEFDAVIDQIARDVQITSEPGPTVRNRQASNSLFFISFRYPIRSKAIEVVEKLLTILMEDTLGASESESATSIAILEEQQGRADTRLVAAENRMRDFRQQNAGFLPDERGGYFDRLQQAESQLDELLRDRNLKDRELRTIEQQLRSEVPVAGNAVVELPENSLEARIQRLEAEIEDLLVRYTEKHPEVLAKRQTLDELQRRRASDLARLGIESDFSSANLAPNPIYEQLRIEKNRAEIELSKLDLTISDLRAQVRSLETMRERAFAVETELAQIDRDYEVIKEQYNNITQALEKARLSEDVVGPVQFQIVNPPSADLTPVAPNRMVMNSLVLVAALAVGGVVSYWLSQLRPVFASAGDLRAVTGVPVLGTVSTAWRDKHRSKMTRQAIAVSTTLLTLGVAYSVTIYFSLSGFFPIAGN